MTSYCRTCGAWRDLDASTAMCADCDLAWAEAFKAATKRETQ